MHLTFCIVQAVSTKPTDTVLTSCLLIGLIMLNYQYLNLCNLQTNNRFTQYTLLIISFQCLWRSQIIEYVAGRANLPRP